MIIRGMGRGSEAAEFLKVDNGFVVSFADVIIHSPVEFYCPVEWLDVRANHFPQIVNEVAGTQNQHASVP